MALRSSLKRVAFTAAEKRALFALALLFFVGGVALIFKSMHQQKQGSIHIENADLYGAAEADTNIESNESLEVDLQGGDRKSSERDVAQDAYLTGNHNRPEIDAQNDGESEVQSGDALLSINSATLEELDELPGIGPVLAGRIIEYRDVHGPFQDIHDLLLIRGIGERTFQRVRPYIAVQP